MSYIKYGWDKLLLDPDNGENCRRKLATVSDASSVNAKLFQSVPDAQDVQQALQYTKDYLCYHL